MIDIVDPIIWGDVYSFEDLEPVVADVMAGFKAVMKSSNDDDCIISTLNVACLADIFLIFLGSCFVLPSFVRDSSIEIYAVLDGTDLGQAGFTRSFVLSFY